jgi:hypothetical protein
LYCFDIGLDAIVVLNGTKLAELFSAKSYKYVNGRSGDQQLFVMQVFAGCCRINNCYWPLGICNLQLALFFQTNTCVASLLLAAMLNFCFFYRYKLHYEE